MRVSLSCTFVINLAEIFQLQYHASWPMENVNIGCSKQPMLFLGWFFLPIIVGVMATKQLHLSLIWCASLWTRMLSISWCILGTWFKKKLTYIYYKDWYFSSVYFLEIWWLCLTVYWSNDKVILNLICPKATQRKKLVLQSIEHQIGIHSQCRHMLPKFNFF